MSVPVHQAAIQRIENGRPDLLVFEVTSRVDRADIQRMAEAVDAAMDTHDLIDILIVFTEFEGVTLGALFDGEAMGVGLRSNTHVRRYAVVGAPALAEVMITLFDPVSPVEARTFELDALDQARSWVDRGSEARQS